jgi:hypothetical protein
LYLTTACCIFASPWLPTYTVHVWADRYAVNGWGQIQVIHLAPSDAIDAQGIPFGLVEFVAGAGFLIAAWRHRADRDYAMSSAMLAVASTTALAATTAFQWLTLRTYGAAGDPGTGLIIDTVTTALAVIGLTSRLTADPPRTPG